jgi:6-phosphogluconolactonase
MSMSLRAILAVPVIRIAMTGEEKRKVYEEACHGKDTELPIRTLLLADHPHLTVHWAP